MRPYLFENKRKEKVSKFIEVTMDSTMRRRKMKRMINTNNILYFFEQAEFNEEGVLKHPTVIKLKNSSGCELIVQESYETIKSLIKDIQREKNEN